MDETELGETQSADETTPRRAETRTTSRLRRGDALGRYLIIDVLGSGGMGVVYSAFDPDLGRAVAIKLLRPGPEAAADGSLGRSRLLREAQALAQLQHPNVITVHDVGEHDGQVFVAMEHIQGLTLRRWLDDERRAWHEVLDVMLAASRGLHAAHTKGMVHRDFKPDNVMLATDEHGAIERVLVMDFGLATPVDANDSAPADIASSAASQLSGPSRLESLTRTGAVMGTPAYMAPEQHAGEPTDARTDQFAFCVTLYEALYGQRPFGGDTVFEISARIIDGELTPPPRGVQVPRWLHQAVRRGLAHDPAQRWPSILALQEGIEHGRRRTRRGRLVVGISVLALGVATAAGLQQLDRRRRIEACEEAGTMIDQVWNADVRRRLEAALQERRPARGIATVARLSPWLDEHTAAWRDARTQTCLDHDVHQTWSDDTHERSRWCLDMRRMELEALVTELLEADEDAIDRAVTAAANLGSVESCRDEGVLARSTVPPADSLDRARRLRREQWRASALVNLGDYEGALTAARALREQTEALGWPPLIGSSRLTEAQALLDLGRYDEAEAGLERVYFDAARADAHEVALAAAQTLVHLVGVTLARPAEGILWAEHADVMRSQLPDPGGLREARLLSDLAGVHRSSGNLDEAKALHERALALRSDALGPEHPTVAMSLNNLASVCAQQDDDERASSLQGRAIEIWERTLGPEHPHVAAGLGNLANIHRQRGELEEAERAYERALAVQEQALGAEHPDLAVSLHNLATMLFQHGQLDRARSLFERTVAIRERALEADHPDLLATRRTLAILYGVQGALAEAEAIERGLVASMERVHGSQSPKVASAMQYLAATVYAAGRPEESLELRRRAFELYESAQGPEHPDTVQSLAELALALSQTGDEQGAIARYEQVLALEERVLGPTEPRHAFTLNNFAELLLERGDVARARALYQQSREILEQAKGPIASMVAHPLLGLAKCELEEGRHEDAVPLAERALELGPAARMRPTSLAEARFALARALTAEGRPPPRARSLAEQARDAYANAEGEHAEDIARIDRWLAARARRR